MATGPATISLNNVTYPLEDLATGKIKSQSAFERNVLTFCKRWLSGEPQFTLSTSGSTGAPKKISITREQMTASAQMTQKALGLRRGHNALVCLDPQHIAGIMMLVRSFVTGMNMVVVEPCANPLAHIPSKVSIDFAAFVPYQISTIIATQKEKERLDALRCAIIGGGTIDAQLGEKLKAIRCPLYATYGMTETLSHIALQRLNGSHAQTYFQALPPIHLKTDERGCLVVKADFLPEEIITNDLVELHGIKFLWLGRWDNVINSGGIKIIPEVLEQQLKKIFDPLETRFFVTALPDKDFGEKICLVIEGKEEDFPSIEKLRQDMQSSLNPYHVPREIQFIGRFVETESGKINRPKTIDFRS